MTKSGWHKIAGYDVYVDSEGCVEKAIKKSVTGCGYDPAYFWVPCTTGGWNRFYMEDHPLTLKQFKYRVYRGTMIVF